MLTFDPESFKTIKRVEINKIGAAEAGDNREPSSIWCQPDGKKKVKVKKTSWQGTTKHLCDQGDFTC